jgi:5'-3' exonuclease
MSHPNRKPLKCETGGTRLLVDGDILLYRIGFTTNEETVDIAKIRMNQYIDEILYNSGCSDYTIYLTDSKGNYRNSLYPDYKANRSQQDKPKHYQALKEYLLEHEAAEVAWGMEADDALGINQNENTIIASIDKDLLMVTGRHFNFVRNSFTTITPEEGMKRFYAQLLTGDKTDNIPGLWRVGAKTAEKILERCKSEKDYKETVFKAYKEKLGKELPDDNAIRERVQLIGSLLWILRSPDEKWVY